MRRLMRGLRRLHPLGPLKQNERVQAGDQHRPHRAKWIPVAPSRYLRDVARRNHLGNAGAASDSRERPAPSPESPVVERTFLTHHETREITMNTETVTVTIRSRWTNAPIYITEIPADTPSGMQTRISLEKATTERAYLRGAYLRGAYLRGAYLRNGFKLVGKRPVLCIGPIGSASRTIFAWITDKGLRIEAGCFFGSRDEFLAILEKTHGKNDHAREYKTALMLIDDHAEIWTPVAGASATAPAGEVEAA